MNFKLINTSLLNMIRYKVNGGRLTFRLIVVMMAYAPPHLRQITEPRQSPKTN